MSQIEIAWLAGIIDGEGFTDSLPKVKAVRIGLESSDFDIVQRCQDFSGMGTISGPRIRGNNKPIWVWRVSKRRDVFRLLLAISPLLCVRRKKKILELTEMVFGP